MKHTGPVYRPPFMEVELREVPADYLNARPTRGAEGIALS